MKHQTQKMMNLQRGSKMMAVGMCMASAFAFGAIARLLTMDRGGDFTFIGAAFLTTGVFLIGCLGLSAAWGAWRLWNLKL